jgi:CRISPR-associated endonuclease/helicase Cas3
MGMSVEEFERYFEALNEVRPFPWQRRLASQLLEGADWPTTIALPTATGKTAVLDIAVFCLAAQAENGTRTVGRRIFYVVERRLIVDEAYERAKRIADKLRIALERDDEGILSKVAKKLMKYGGESPLETVRLRGAMYRDEDWADSPVQPLIVVSTVDQVGSRLLFRGYGLSDGARPLHAALIANDSLVILDEAHISLPFSETVQAVERYRSEAWADVPLGLPFKLVTMSATSSSYGFSLSEEDEKDPVLEKRLKACKIIRLHRVKDDKFEDEVTKLAMMHDGDVIVAVVLNTVSAARGVFGRLQNQAVNAVLLTGRSRPYDRDLLMREIGPQIEARKRAERKVEGHLIVVATQCIEVGADFDFDAMVTECASLDALIQRLGRVNRFGRNDVSRVDIVVREKQTKDPDWLYGEALKETWAWFHKKGKQFNFCPAALEIPRELAMEQKHSPVMLPVYLDSWVQTNPSPNFEPSVALFLHGQESDAEVQLVWRADLDPENSDLWMDTVSLFPPRVREAIPVPLSAVKSWLVSQPAKFVSDLEGSSSVPGDRVANEKEVLRWDGPRKSQVIQPADIQPGDTLVMPAVYGGADKYGWNPDSKESVPDIAEPVSSETGYPTLRLHRSVMKNWFGDVESSESFMQKVERLLREPDEAEVRDLLEYLLDSKVVVNEDVSRIASSLLKEKRINFSRYPSDDGLVIKGTRRPGWDEEDSSFSPRPVALLDHSEGVRAKACEFATAIGLSEALLQDIALAAFLHDAGKADRRFQVWLHRGDEIAARTAKELLAKSGMGPDRKASELARELSGYPKSARHEGLSVSMIANSEAVRERAKDFDLVLHLVASHHGYSRPFFPVLEDQSLETCLTLGEFRLSGDANHRLWELDSGVPDRFWILTRRYGYYGLAFLEAVVRLADHRRSAEEERKGD